MPSSLAQERPLDDDPAPPTAAPTWRSIARPMPDDLLVLVGPTASGKTELSLRLCEAFGGEVVGADSVQIYRDFDIGSGKPTPQELARAPHHLVSTVDPRAPVDAAAWAEMAERAIADIRARGRVPIVCGGTFLWIKALVWGLMPAPPADPDIRARHTAIAEAEGRGALHTRLASVDPESAARLAPNDLVRVSRALEIWELSGKPQSVWFAEHGFQEQRHKARFVGVSRAREELDARIRTRTRTWLAGGWLDEVKDLLARGHGDTRAMGSVGYKQVREHLAGTIPAAELEDTIVRATRVFARRQRTWLRELEVSWCALD